METAVEYLEEFDMSAEGNVFYDVEVEYFSDSHNIEVEIIDED